MTKTKLSLLALMILASTLAFKAVISLSITILPAHANSLEQIDFQHEAILKENMSSLLGIDQSQIKSTKVEKATWKNCYYPKRSNICTIHTSEGFRVTMSGKGENWVYYVYKNGLFVQDNLASLSPAIHEKLAQQLEVKSHELKIKAVELVGTQSTCHQNTAICNSGSTVEWRILSNVRTYPIQLKLNGDLSNFPKTPSRLIPLDRSGMPLNLISKVLQDMAFRNRYVGKNFKVVSIKPTTENGCQNQEKQSNRGEVKECLKLKKSGWQIIILNGNDQYFYYVPRTATDNLSSYIPEPDAMQSLSSRVINAVKADALSRGDVSFVLFAKPRYFDGCLDVKPEMLICTNFIHAGWEVTFAQPQTPTNSSEFQGIKTLTYHISFRGEAAEFVNASNWFPQP